MARRKRSQEPEEPDDQMARIEMVASVFIESEIPLRYLFRRIHPEVEESTGMRGGQPEEDSTTTEGGVGSSDCSDTAENGPEAPDGGEQSGQAEVVCPTKREVARSADRSPP